MPLLPDPLHPYSPFVAAPCSFGRGESLSVLRGAFFIPVSTQIVITPMLQLSVINESRGSELAREEAGTAARSSVLEPGNAVLDALRSILNI